MKYLIFIVIPLLFSQFAVAQNPKKAGGSAAGSSPTATGATTTSPQPGTAANGATGSTYVNGYSYLLPYKLHIKYRTVKISKRTQKMPASAIPDSCYILKRLLVNSTMAMRMDTVPDAMLKLNTKFDYLKKDSVYYYLKNHHLAKGYSTIPITDINDLPYSDTARINPGSLNFYKPINDTSDLNPNKVNTISSADTAFFKGKHVRFDPAPGLPSMAITIYFGIYNNQVPYDTCLYKPKPPCCDIKYNDSLVNSMTKVVVLDTIDRYYYKRRSWLGAFFKAGRLRVSASQTDSGKLVIQFKTRHFVIPDSLRATSYLDVVRQYPADKISVGIPIINSDSANNFYLQIPRRYTVGDNIPYLKLYYSILQYGAVTIPFKYRFANHRPIGGFNPSFNAPTATGPTPVLSTNTYEKNDDAPAESTASINLAGYIGWKFGYTQFNYDQTQTHNTLSWMIGGFFGPALIPLTANNVNYNTDLNRHSSTELTLSTGGFVSVEIRSFSLGLFGGSDIPIESSPWVYRYKPWVGIGFGFNLGVFSSASPSGEQSSK